MDIIFKGRHTDVQERFRERATAKLSKIGKLDSKAIRVDVEVSAEHNPRQSDRRERVELTITSRGPAIRAEAAGQDRFAALDLALAKLESRLRRVGDRRKARRGPVPGARPGELLAEGLAASRPGIPEPAGPGPGEAGQPDSPQPGTRPGAASAQPEATAPSVPQARPGSPGPAPGASSAQTGIEVTSADDVVPIEMEGDGPLVVREKFHLAQPMPIDQALFEMELVGHDFFLFRDCEDGCPSVVYRRRGYQYGVIRLVEEPPAGAAAGSTADPVTAPADGHAARRAGRGAARQTDVAAG